MTFPTSLVMRSTKALSSWTRSVSARISVFMSPLPPGMALATVGAMGASNNYSLSRARIPIWVVYPTVERRMRPSSER